MFHSPHYKRKHPSPIWGRGVMVALLAFNQAGGGSSPSDLISAERTISTYVGRNAFPERLLINQALVV